MNHKLSSAGAAAAAIAVALAFPGAFDGGVVPRPTPTNPAAAGGVNPSLQLAFVPNTGQWQGQGNSAISVQRCVCHKNAYAKTCEQKILIAECFFSRHHDYEENTGEREDGTEVKPNGEREQVEKQVYV